MKEGRLFSKKKCAGTARGGGHLLPQKGKMIEEVARCLTRGGRKTTKKRNTIAGGERRSMGVERGP